MSKKIQKCGTSAQAQNGNKKPVEQEFRNCGGGYLYNNRTGEFKTPSGNDYRPQKSYFASAYAQQEKADKLRMIGFVTRIFTDPRTVLHFSEGMAEIKLPIEVFTDIMAESVKQGNL